MPYQILFLSIFQIKKRYIYFQKQNKPLISQVFYFLLISLSLLNASLFYFSNHWYNQHKFYLHHKSIDKHTSSSYYSLPIKIIRLRGTPSGLSSAGVPLLRTKAEERGFEPLIRLTPDNGFQDRRVQPLCHSSMVS